MDRAEAVHRAWFILEIGTFILGLAALQVLFGRTPRAYPKKWPEWVRREKEPRLFWSNIFVWLALGLYCIGLAAARLIPFSN
jgi:hypothetical protein